MERATLLEWISGSCCMSFSLLSQTNKLALYVSLCTYVFVAYLTLSYFLSLPLKARRISLYMQPGKKPKPTKLTSLVQRFTFFSRKSKMGLVQTKFFCWHGGYSTFLFFFIVSSPYGWMIVVDRWGMDNTFTYTPTSFGFFAFVYQH